MSARIRGVFLLTVGLLGQFGCAGDRPNNLGVQGGSLAACPASPNCVSSQSGDKRHRIAPLAFSGPSESAFNHLKLILGKRSDTTIIDEAPDYLRVEFRTLLFIDDGEFLLDRTRMVIHLRSASRLGYSDLGKNRSRIEDIRKEFSGKGNQE